MIRPNSSPGDQPALGVDLQLELHGAGDRLLANRAGRNLHILLAHGGDDVAGGQVASGELVGVEPNPHR